MEAFDIEDLFYDSKEEKTAEVVESYCTSNHKEYFFSLKTVESIPSGLYGLTYSQMNGFGLSKMDYKKEDFIYLPSSPHEKILNDIKNFWNNKAAFQRYGLTPKRGIIMYGDPGCGKTSCIYLLVEEVKKLNGIAVYFNNPDNWIEVAKMVRKIEKDRPMLCIIEDLDLVINKFGEDAFLNFLDGLNQVENVVYVATTNNIGHLTDRIQNRPSRFDQRYEIKKPDEKDRLFYFEQTVHEDDRAKYDLKKLAKDTKDFSMAHLRETLISLYIMGSEYTETLKRLKNKKIHDTPKGSGIGFGFDEDEMDPL